MIAIVIVLSLMQAFLIDQIDFWGALPMLWVVFLVVYKKHMGWHELLMWSAVFSLTFASFSYVNPLLHIVATLLASAACIGGIMIAQNLKVTRKSVWLHTLTGTASYVMAFFIISTLPIVSQASRTGIIAALIGTILINFGLSYGGLYMSKQHKVARR